jgi:hypothetical protein
MRSSARAKPHATLAERTGDVTEGHAKEAPCRTRRQGFSMRHRDTEEVEDSEGRRRCLPPADLYCRMRRHLA